MHVTQPGPATAMTEWPQRAWLLAGLGAVAGGVMWLLTRSGNPSPLALAAATFVGVFALVVATTLERRRWSWSVGFAGLCGLIVALVIRHGGAPGAGWASDMEGWRVLSALLTVVIAAPFFQCFQDAGRWRTDYPDLYRYALTNVVMTGGAIAFVAAVFVVAFLLSRLFDLIGIHILRALLGRPGLPIIIAGAALGGAIGVLRDRDRMLGSLQKGALAVPALLTPVLGAGLLLFLVSLMATGLMPLWQATRSTTPILLGCMAGGVFLINAVVGDGPDDESRARPVRWGALGIALSLVPLAIIAAVSLGVRVNQHGLTPDRMWAMVFVGVAGAYAVAYLGAVLLRRAGWMAAVRRANVGLALGLVLLALLLATPLIGFGAISARNQETRLLKGKVSVEAFDWATLGWGFGPEGRQVLARLAARAPDPAMRATAAAALRAPDRWSFEDGRDHGVTAARRLTVLPAGTEAPTVLTEALTAGHECGTGELCVVRLADDGRSATIVYMAERCEGCVPQVMRYRADDRGGWSVAEAEEEHPLDAATLRREAEAGRVTLRAVPGRRLYVGDVPVGPMFEAAAP